LAATIKELPEFNRTKMAYNLHFDLMAKVNDLIAKRNLVKLTDLELTIATGFNNEG
jgi:hypothetical protein